MIDELCWISERIRCRLISSRNAYVYGRAFGRGRLFSAWLCGRFLVTGRTGKYRIKNYH